MCDFLSMRVRHVAWQKRENENKHDTIAIHVLHLASPQKKGRQSVERSARRLLAVLTRTERSDDDLKAFN